MHKHPETSTKARSYAKHLKPYGKRVANKSTRRVGRKQARSGV